jgi:ATP-dependent DNA helicase RecG
VICADESGQIVLVFFKARADYLTRVLPPGGERMISGLVEAYGDGLQMVHPDHICAVAAAGQIGGPDAAAEPPAIEPVYPLAAGITLRTLQRVVPAALARLPPLDEWLDPALRAREGWPSWAEAVRAVHALATDADLAPLAPARARLAYDELLANQLALALVRRRMTAPAGPVIPAQERVAATALARLGFTLTRSQQAALAAISADMAAGTRMLRLLQGDVGSGKTVVAAIAMLNAVACGFQAALMAPTEVLARQHYRTLEPLCAASSVEAALLTGRSGARERRGTLEGLASGRIGLVVGTHALIQDEIAFHGLGLAVIDEQQRFGVHERLALAQKGKGVHVLVMTATPIPRTLTLTLYGDLDVSVLTEKPPGRRPVDTRVVSLARLETVVAGLGRALGQGAKAYWICPLVAESEAIDLAAAEARAAALRQPFGARVGLLHGRMKSEDKDKVIAAFADGDVDLLVSTTVIEVGVDVPAATLMVIEHAERFGLAQLHQLRGRVGRSARPSSCLLLYAPPLTETARARLGILRETEDGFRIAEEDLRLRGAGEILGCRQSGMPAFRLADLAHHGTLLATARDDVRLVLAQDPGLASPRGQALRTLLYLFEQDRAVPLIRSG